MKFAKFAKARKIAYRCNELRCDELFAGENRRNHIATMVPTISTNERARAHSSALIVSFHVCISSHMRSHLFTSKFFL